MTKTLILTPNRNSICGMFQLAKDLAKEFDGDIMTRNDKYLDYEHLNKYNDIITFLYPMHQWGKDMKKYYNKRWICYDQKVPPITKTYFPNFWRRQAMRYINWRNNATMKGADEDWDVTEREQKPRYKDECIGECECHLSHKSENPNICCELCRKKKGLPFLTYQGVDLTEDYFIYTGRTTDYKNYYKLKNMMQELNIPFVHPENEPDNIIHALLSNAKCYVTMSIWEGFGRGVNEASALNLWIVAYDVGTHKKHIKKGICVPLDIDNMVESEEKFKEAILEVWKK